MINILIFCFDKSIVDILLFLILNLSELTRDGSADSPEVVLTPVEGKSSTVKP